MNNGFPKTEVIVMNQLAYRKIMKDIKYLKPVLKSELNDHYVYSLNVILKEQNTLILYQHLKLKCCEGTLFVTPKF